MQVYLSQSNSLKTDSLETLEFLTVYVKNCTDPYFPVILKARNKQIEKPELRLKIAQSYDTALDNCLKEAIAGRDTNLFQVVLAAKRANTFDLDVERSIMKTRLIFYNRYDRQIYAKWVVHYMNFYMRKSIDDLRREADLAASKIFKEMNLNEHDKELFIQKWISSENQSIAGDLIYFSKKLNKDFDSQQNLEMVIAWSQRACELQPISEHYNTYALFLCKLKRYDEAINQQQKALEFAIKNNEEKQVPIYERELQNMIEEKKNSK